MLKKTVSLYITLNLFVLSAMVNTCLANEPQSFSKFVDEKGTISSPQDFRKTMTHLGSWFVPTGDASGFHDVYSKQTDIDSYKKTGVFPDGAILIKELRVSKSADYTTGNNVHYATETVKQWFVMIKDSKQRFANNKNWGDGWGWALFKNGNANNISLDYKKDCIACHLPAKENDLIYIEAYPTLRQ